MAAMQEIICECGCGRKKMVRTADVKRGWGKFFSKSCKSRAQENRTHQNAKYHQRKSKSSESFDQAEDDWEYYLNSMHPFSSEALGQD